MGPSIVIALLIAMMWLRFYLKGKTVGKRSKDLIRPEDMNKEPHTLLHVMDKVYLKLDIIDNPGCGIKQDIDHRKELLEDIDEYLSNMRPFITVTKNSLIMPKESFAHIGYYFQGDLYDLDGKHLYESKRWVNDLNNHFPWIKKGFIREIFNAIRNMFKRN